ncbi:condensation domain-containing protein [Paenibacillus sp. MER 180]|uniref:condensation domain-containing protein n=1 Tax=Paenibacillus sp. MER 180 TaxID=2939570 RepID=UPI00203DBA93|nr:condensation domain-containing protein [Paenibacillus sp. MER 180]MCM3291421.1 condensation domain-containing protein [Paenibacillus sp. MER 180]
MSSFKEIAIIGMSGRFPSIQHLDELDSIFVNKNDCVKPFSDTRRDLLGLDPDKKYFEVAYIDGVEYFDYDFFHLSKQEAAYMDPQQKMILELACEAIENAGYSLEAARGSNTSVVLGAHNSHFYDDYVEDASGVAMIGNFLDSMAGRISYSLDLHGQSAIVQTACSSSLYAIYEACIRLNARETEMALAGGITLEFRVKYDDYAETDVLGLISPHGRCSTFDERANGINLGEGAGFVLLKRYEDAVRDKDPIHAVIRSVAANQDGGRSNSLAAPSAAAQTEVILKAWEKANIHPEDIGYIEAHGTGTKIGDPIEILGITEAFRKYTDKTKICPIGSLKTNFSHLGSAAGIASVIKGIISMKHNKKYPLRELKKINSLIDFEYAPVYPITEVEHWDEHKPKMMGISGFGVSGTNVHLVLEENKTNFCTIDSEKEYFITISAKTKDAVEDYKKKLKAGIAHYSLGDIGFTLNAGRNDYEYRVSAKVKNKMELMDFLDSPVSTTEAGASKMVFLLSGDASFDEHALQELNEKYTVFRTVYQDLLGKITLEHEDMLKLIGYIALYHQFEVWGITPHKLLGTGIGNIAIDFIMNKISLHQAEQEIARSSNGAFNHQGFEAYITKLLETEHEALIFVEMGDRGKLSECLQSRHDHHALNVVRAISDDYSLLDALSALYNIGVNIDWEKYYSTKEQVKVHLPTYPFRKTLAWPKKLRSKVAVRNVESEAAIDEGQELKRFLKDIWCNELDMEEIGESDDFFDLGANSLMTISVTNLIKQKTGVELDFDDFYTYATIQLLEEHIKNQMNHSGAASSASSTDDKQMERAVRKELMNVSYNQRRMLYFLENVDQGSLYNMPFIFKIEGAFHMDAFQYSLEKVIERHEIMRTIYVKKDGVYYQKVLDEYSFTSEYEARRGEAADDIIKEMKSAWNQEFDLFREIPIRSKLIQADNNLHLWFVTMHHIAADGSSMAIFGRDMAAFYSQYSQGITSAVLPELSLQVVDFAEWENRFLSSELAQRQAAFWKKELKDINGLLSFPVDKERPQMQTFNGSSIEFELTSDTVEKCKAYCKGNNLTLFMLLETVFALALYRYSNDPDICVAVPVSNRFDERLKQTVGFFANTVAMRTVIQPESSCKAVLSKNKEMIANVYANVELPFEEVISSIEFQRDAAYSPLVQYMFVFQNFAMKEMGFDEARMTLMELESSSAKFEMTLMLYEKDSGIAGLVEYNTDLFYASTVQKFIEAYQYMLNYVIEHDDISVNQLPLEQAAALVGEGRNRAEDYSF